MDEIILEFSLTPDDYGRAVREYMVKNKTQWIISGWLGVPLIVLFFTSFFNHYINAENLGRYTLGLVIGFFALWFPFMSPAQAKNQALKNKKPSTSQKYIFSQDEISITTSEFDGKCKWSIYQSVLESKRFYFLVGADNIFLLIPKRAFQNAEQEKFFRDLAVHHYSTIKNISKGINGWKLTMLVGILSLIINYVLLEMMFEGR
jgi:hypothetical protein